MNDAWLLPEYIEDILPPYARQAESLRRRLLDLFDTYGYELVWPPMLEYLDSLLTGTAGDLDLKTFKVVDALSGRMMGVRADITPQMARIDAHLLNRHGVARLCYAGSVLHTQPDGLLAAREPYQVGAELFGHAGIEADREILSLLLASLRAARLGEFRVSLGHVGLFRALSAAAGVTRATERPLFRALRSKDVPALVQLTHDLSEPWRNAFLVLPELYGGPGVIAEAREQLPGVPGVVRALDDLAALMESHPGMDFAVDLSDLRGFGYHTGVVFAAYVGGQAQSVAVGGRYDGTGAVFGRARPATGFSLDLRRLLLSLPEPRLRTAILAPLAGAPGLEERIAELRAGGERVVVELPGQEENRLEAGCDRHLVFDGGVWKVKPLYS